MSKPQEILELEKAYGITLEETDNSVIYAYRANNYLLNKKHEVIGLNLRSNQISKIENLEMLTNLSELYISSNQISKIENLEKLTNLSKLGISANQISKIENLEKLTNLSELNISSNQISKIENLEKLTNLSRLNISGNQISKIENLEMLINLSKLYIPRNQISKIENLEKLTNLSTLDISYNQISKIDVLKGVLKLPKLNYLEVHKNPFVATENLILKKRENHLDIIKSELQKSVELEKDDGITIQFPVKVMLLGNHASGKSTLVTYFKTNKLAKVTPTENTSTHVLSVVHSKEEINYDLPKTIFYDFGGQDYYHGVYRAFFTQETVNLLVWHPKSNHNKLLAKDSNNFATRNYKRSYWLAQLRYAFDKKNTNEDTVYDDPVLLIQTRADEENTKENWQQAFLRHNIVDEFHISLNAEQNSAKNKAILNYLMEAFWETVKSHTEKRKEPEWFPEFLSYIINKKNPKAISLETIIQYYKREVAGNFTLKDKKKSLQVDLEQLSRKGMLLYYKEDEKLNDVAWLNPAATVEEIHKTILNKNTIRDNKGTLTPQQFEDLEIDKKIEGLLINEKVLFFDKGNNEYIIPNYLPLTSEDDKIYNLLKFDYSEPTFVLKFERFIPFGFINQLICHYGQNPDKKQYWRDQLIFTLDGKFKIWIQLDFSRLTIKVYIRSKKPKDTEISKITQQIFREILFLYWDETILNEKDEDVQNVIDQMISKDKYYAPKMLNDFHKKEFNKLGKPDDLYISTDNEYFVHYNTLNSSEKTKETISAYLLPKGKNDLDKTNVRTQSSYQYQNFTDNPNIQRMKKIFISYSRKDVEYKDELRKHLNMLKMFDVADNWSCEDITIGKWHDQIQKELRESDLVIFMLSINFFNSDYILDKEVIETFNQIAEGNPKNVLCVIVSKFSGLENFDEDKMNSRQKNIIKLASYQYASYYRKKNEVTGNMEEYIISLKEASRLGILDEQLTKITDKILSEI